jgi:hypothetical protein
MIPLSIVTIHVPCINKRVSAHNTLPTPTIKDMWTQIYEISVFILLCPFASVGKPTAFFTVWRSESYDRCNNNFIRLSSQQKHKWSLYGDQPQEIGVGTQCSADCLCLHHQVHDAWQLLMYVSTSLLWQTHYDTPNISPILSWLNTQQTSLTTATVKSLDSKDLINVHTRPHLLQV